MTANIDQTLAQQIVNTVKDVCGYDVNFIDCSGMIYASTDETRIGTFHKHGKIAAQRGDSMEVNEDSEYFGTHRGVNLPVSYKGSILAVIGITGNPEEVRKYACLAQRITRLLIREQELNAFSRTQSEKRHYVLHSLISRNPQNYPYILHCLEDFKISKDSPKRILILRLVTDPHPNILPPAESQITELFSQSNIVLFSFEYPDKYLAVTKESDFIRYKEKLMAFAANHPDTVQIAVGKAAKGISLADSHFSAITALRSMSGAGGNFTVFDNLSLELILSSVSSNDRAAYLEKTIGTLSQTEQDLISAYFEEEMSLSKTAARLFVHKNTLQYKLDHIYRKCGLNPRKFRDAVLLYLALRMKSCYNSTEPIDEKEKRSQTYD